MAYLPRPQAPELSRAQAARMDRWWEWKREQDRISAEMLEAFKAEDLDKFAELAARAESMPEPDKFNG